MLYVVDDRPFLLLDDGRVDLVTGQLEREGETMLADAAAPLEDVGVDVTTRMRTGTPPRRFSAPSTNATSTSS